MPIGREHITDTGAGRRLLSSMADDGGSSSGPVDTSGGQGAVGESNGLGLGGMLLNISILILVGLGCVVLYRRWGRRLVSSTGQGDEASALPKMRRRDFTLEQLREYDGLQNPRILMAVNMKVFDVTSGKKFYGKGELVVGERGCKTYGLLADSLVSCAVQTFGRNSDVISLALLSAALFNKMLAIGYLARWPKFCVV